MNEVFKGKGNAGKGTNVKTVTKKCPHNRRRCECKLCGGASICEHKRIKSKCVECRGSAICEHNHRRIECKVSLSLFLTSFHSVGSLSLSLSFKELSLLVGSLSALMLCTAGDCSDGLHRGADVVYIFGRDWVDVPVGGYTEAGYRDGSRWTRIMWTSSSSFFGSAGNVQIVESLSR